MMNPTGGYIRLHRKILQNPMWLQLAPAVLKVAVYFILRANYKSIQWYDGAQQIPIQAGSFIASYASVAAGCNLTVQQVRDAFCHLERTQFATYRRTHRWTLVSVLNYEVYQATASEGNTQENTEENTCGNGQGTTVQEIKNKKSKKTPPTPSAEGELLKATAKRIHDRHPQLRRDCSVAAVESQLRKIVARLPVAEQKAKLILIDKHHEGWCSSPQWQKEGGNFAKGLNNWLAPTKGRFDEPFSPAAATSVWSNEQKFQGYQRPVQ